MTSEANPSAPPAGGKRRRGLRVVLGVVLGLCVLLAAAVGYVLFLQPKPVPRPLVTISSPGEGQRVAVGEEVSVAAIARGEDRIVRLELWADGVLQQVLPSSLPGGSSPFPLMTTWLPSSPGPHTLTARAFSTRGERTHASVTVEAVAAPDQDADGVADEADACPQEPGSAGAAGCPDADADGIADAQDSCPGEPGVAAGDGCPAPSEGDRDGDGVADAADASPDEPGSPRAAGAPDADGDGVGDAADACPEVPGWSADGCPEPAGPDAGSVPDADGDGVGDSRDLCPEAPGAPEAGGCPPSEAGDRDGDGVADDVDLAPEEPGLPEHGGCPPPDADADGDGVADEDEMPEVSLEAFPLLFYLQRFFLPVPKALTPVEFQALELGTHQVYDRVVCYVSLGDGPAERVGPLDSPNGMTWNIGEHLGPDAGRVLMAPDDQPFPLCVQCAAYRTVTQDVPDETPEGTFGDAHAEEAYFDLGTLTASDPPEVWDGRELYAVSVRDSDPPGRVFHLRYRICAGSCEESPLPPPVLSFNGDRTDPYLRWSWDGDPDAIDGFFLRCQCPGFATRTIPKNRNWLSISDLKPACGEECSYTLYAEGTAPGVESPPSNTVVWEGEPCPGVMRITFRLITTYGHDNSICERGPLYGAFWANGEYLWFDGADPGYFDLEEGYYIEPAYPGGNCGITIQSMFDSIRALAHDYPAFSYQAPFVNQLSVPMRPDQDLTVGFRISDYNREGGATTIADRSATIPASHLMGDDFNRAYDWHPVEFDAGAGWYTMWDDNCYLYFFLEWIDKPETP